MSIRKYKAEQIVTVLRQIEVQMANGQTAPQACKKAESHTQTYYRWRKEYGGLKLVWGCHFGPTSNSPDPFFR